MARNRYINVNPVMRDGEQFYRARLFPPFDVELGIKPRPIDFYSKTKEGADAKRAAYQPPDKKLDKKTGFVDVVSEVYIPGVRKRIDDKEISYGYGSYSISLLERFLTKPDKKDAPNVYAARIRKVRLGLLTPTMTNEYFAALKADNVPAEATHRIKQQIAGALKLVKDRLGYPIVTYFEDCKLPTIVTNKKRPVYDHEQVFAICRDGSKLIEDRALIGFLFMMQCRPSELFALTWDDIDLKNGIVSFNKATRQTAKNKYEVTAGSKAQKTGQVSDDVGIRDVKMPVLLFSLLRELKKFRSDMGKTTPWAFTTVTGLPLQPGVRIRRRWAAIVKRTGLPTGKGAPTFYTLKHAGNSYALSTGVSGDVQAYKMGQTTSRMANRNYRTILTPEKQRQADVFDAHVPSNAPDSSA
jgi:integrase